MSYKPVARNHTIDFMRIVLIFLIVCVHFPFNGFFGIVVKEIAQSAVPLFFMITGFYLYDEDKIKISQKASKQAKHISVLCLWSFIIYLIYRILEIIVFKHSFSLWVKSSFNLKNMFEFIVLNDPPVLSTLWFLFAMLYDLFIISFVCKRIHIKKLFFLIIPICIIRLCIGSYSVFVFGVKIDILWTKNFIFAGMLSMLVGFWIASLKDKLCNFFSNKILILLSLFFGITTICEWIFIYYARKYNYCDYFISTIFFTTFVFILWIKNPLFIKDNEQLCKRLGQIGKKYSLYIYIIHRMVSYITDIFVRKFIPYFWCYYISVKAIIVFVISFGVSFVYLYLYNKIKNRRLTNE